MLTPRVRPNSSASQEILQSLEAGDRPRQSNKAVTNEVVKDTDTAGPLATPSLGLVSIDTNSTSFFYSHTILINLFNTSLPDN